MKSKVLAFAFAVTLPTTANAATLILAGPATPYAEMVHNNGAPDATTVTLDTMPSGYLVDFISTNVLAPSGGGNGHAQVDGPFTNLTIDPLSPLAGFTAIQFTLNPNGPNNVDYSFDILVNFLGGGSQVFSTDFAPNNKFDILADGDEVISSISFSNLFGATSNRNPAIISYDFADIRQVSFNGVLESEIPDPQGAVPEPSTWAMMLFGFGGIGFAMRRRRKAGSSTRTRSALA